MGLTKAVLNEKYIEAIDELLDQYLKNDNLVYAALEIFGISQFKRVLEETLDDEEENTSVYDGWVSIKDRVPEKNGEYIVQLRGDDEPTSLMYNTTRNQWVDDMDDAFDMVIKWMPFPKV